VSSCLRGERSHLFQFAFEFPDVLEPPIDRREPNIGDLVQRFQLLHHHLSDEPRRDFRVLQPLAGVLHLADEPVNRFSRDGALGQGDIHPATQLLPAERLAPTILLENYQRNLSLFVGRITPLAAEAFPPPPDCRAVADDARVHYPVVEVIAEGAFHLFGYKVLR